MENASKALLIAGGMLLVMLIIGLVMFAWGRFSDFYSRQDELANIEDTAEFNSQFANYERKDVHGYELISLANRIADYNMKYSNYVATSGSDRNAQNDFRYNPITMKIDIKGKADKFRLEVTSNDGIKISSQSQHSFFYNYNNKLMEQSSTRNDILNFISQATGIETHYRNATTATKLAKSVNSLILSKQQIEYNENARNMTEEQSKKTAVDAYKSIIGSNENINYDDMVRNLTGSTGDIMKYYEYYQFKRGIFECTGITYDNVNNRVSTINFKFTGNIE